MHSNQSDPSTKTNSTIVVKTEKPDEKPVHDQHSASVNPDSHPGAALKSAPVNSHVLPPILTASGKPIPKKLTDPSVQQIPTEELLGSVTTFYPSGDAECGHALRTSARVIQKMRMDSIRGGTPPPSEGKAGGAGVHASGGKGSSGPGCGTKTPNQQKQARMVWTNQDKSMFFEALNECGKDFEGIVNYLNTKKRRKDSGSDVVFKVKDVRHLYYQFNQKVSKYLHFSEEVKKEAQELYALINYGEMRKKVPFHNKKYFHKLKDLVYKGVTMIREKGKNIRIKTPSCRALRKLNQLEEWQEEIKLPPRVDVVLKPATVGAWGRVQTLAQNPRCRTSVTLQKRLSTLLVILQQKWRHQDVKLMDRITNLRAASGALTSKVSRQKMLHELELCTKMAEESKDSESQKLLWFTPAREAVIHRPMVNLSEFLSSYSICMNSYEQRIGAKIRGEVLCLEKLNSMKERLSSNSKRQRHDSGSEKHSPDGKKVKSELKDIKEEKSGEAMVGSSFAEVFKSPNASNESLDVQRDGSDTECHGVARNILTNGGISCEDPDLKNADSNDSAKLPLFSLIKIECDSGVSFTNQGENSNDAVPSLESENLKPIPIEESNNGGLAEEVTTPPTEDLIKTTVKRKEPKEKYGKRKDSKTGMSNLHFRPLISEETIQKIREGWTLQNVGDLTIGDLYVMFGEEGKLCLEYDWVMPKELVTLTEPLASIVEESVEQKPDISMVAPMSPSTSQKVPPQGLNGEPTAAAVGIDPKCAKLSGRLKQLLQLVALQEKTGKRRCPCGHVCDRKNKSAIDSLTAASSYNDNLVFKQPLLPIRTSNHPVINTTLANCNGLPPPHMRYKQSRWWRMRVNRHHLPTQQRLAQAQLNGTSNQHLPIRNNNNNYQRPSTATAAAPLKNPIAAGKVLPQIPSTNGNESNGNKAIMTASSNSPPKDSEDDQLSQLLEEKITSYSNRSTTGCSSNGSKKRSSTEISAIAGEDSNSCLSLFDISLPSPSSTMIAELMGGGDDDDDDDDHTHGGDEVDGQGFCRSDLTLNGIDRLTTDSCDGTKILRDAAPIDSDINDISLSSFLGHLDAVYENNVATSRRRESDQMNISIISESSVDYIARFEDIAAELRAQQEQNST
ncbi:protein cramped [Uranotaenia lowii]|uniref:protein cramped n=1 Tax=Uranotaenia lowii TaxID=190385 RepID=UPI002478B7EA|nr:protein cramped [Uranotaenia lowii]